MYDIPTAMQLKIAQSTPTADSIADVVQSNYDLGDAVGSDLMPMGEHAGRMAVWGSQTRPADDLRRQVVMPGQWEAFELPF